MRADLVLSAAGLLHRKHSAPARKEYRTFVALDGGEIVGWCATYLREGPDPSGVVWAGVRHDRRGRGTGTALFEAAAAHLRAVGASTFDSYTSTPEGVRFLERRGYEQVAAAEVSSVDPRRAPLPGDGAAVPLASVLDRARELYALHTGALGEVFGAELSAQAFEEWTTRTLDGPDLSHQGSHVVLTDGHVAALAFLTVVGPRASNEMTATVPQLRGRGLARASKLATLSWAAANGIERIYTANYADNEPMLALNRGLGYEPVATSVDFRAPIAPSLTGST